MKVMLFGTLLMLLLTCEQFPINLEYRLPDRLADTNWGSQLSECDLNPDERTQGVCKKNDDTPCSVMQYWYEYVEEPQDPNKLREAYEYCYTGSQCVRVPGYHPSAAQCDEDTGPIDF